MRGRQASRIAAIAAFTWLSAASSSQAAIITYTDQTAWELAVAALGLNVTVEDFTDAILQTGVSIDDASVSGGVYNGTAITQFNDAGNPKVNFTGTQAFGGTWDLSPGGAGDGLVFVVNGAFTTFQASSGFIGFLSNDATLITSLRLDSPGTGVEGFTLDNLRFATSGSTSVPDPGSTLGLLGIGALTMGLARRCLTRHS